MTKVHQLFDELIHAESLTKNRNEPVQTSDYSDEVLARRFTEQYGEDLKYVDLFGRWYCYDGVRWQADETLLVPDHIRTLVRGCAKEILDTNGKPSLAATIGSAKKVSAIERLARADRQHASKTTDWDSDQWLLNTPDGTVDLRTGQLRPHDRRDLITKVTAVGPGGTCPMWLTFLDRIFNGDRNLIAYIRRMLGYSLTGSIQEHALFFCHGTGGNGKSVLLGTLHKILADYSVVAPMSTFAATQHERHPTELAMLRGARLVTAQETEDGQQWAEAKIKALTGGDPVDARFMRQDFFTFVPTFKLVIAGNHKPSLRNVDEAIRRRLNLIPFNVTIPANERDLQLADKLKEEWPGILAWVIEGCLEWRRIGLAPPDAVVEATENYLIEEDAIGRFIAERCELHPSFEQERLALYAEWKKFAEASGEQMITEKAFSQKLANHGFKKGHHSRTRRVVFRAIRLRPKDDDCFGGGDYQAI